MDIKYWIGLSSKEEIEPSFILSLYEYFGDIERVFNCSEKDLEGINIEINKKKFNTFLSLRDKINLDKTREEVEKRGINVLTFDDERYPKMLKEIHNPPMILYYKGDLFSCNLERTVAFVGSRRASTNGKDSVRRIINDFNNTDICIISGLAEGIDASSHRAALDNNLKTIGVIASGFDFQYPSSNKDLYEKIPKGCGAIVTEYYPTVEPLRFHFPQRNRIVTGLSFGTVVGEAALKSGALISANLTLEQGRELMCIPGSINNKNTEGIYKLLKNGATMVTSGEDVLNALNWEIVPSPIDRLCNGVTPTVVPSPEGRGNSSTIPLEYSTILNIIEVEPCGFDKLQTETGLNTEELLKTLTIMEVEGFIESIEGDRYKRA